MTKPKPIVHEPFEKRFEESPNEDFKACSTCNHLYAPSRESEHLRSPEHLATKGKELAGREFAWACTTCNHLYYANRKSEHLRSPEHLAAAAAERKQREPW